MKLNKILYQILVKLSDNGVFESPWIMKAKHLLYGLGLKNQYTSSKMNDIVKHAALSHYEKSVEKETYSIQKCLNYGCLKLS